MKRILFILFSVLLALPLMAEETTDRIVLSKLTLLPGGDQGFFTVSLEGSSNTYSAYNMDIHLPEGMSLGATTILNEDDEEEETALLKLTNQNGGINLSAHNLSYSFGKEGPRVLRVACIHTSNKNLRATSGNLFNVYVKVSTYAKPGSADILIDGVTLKVAGGTSYYPAARTDTNITIGTSATASLAVNATNQWSTCILPFATELPEGVKAYECNKQDGDNLVLTKAESIEAYTPYLLYAPEGLDATTVTGTIDPTDYPEVGYVSKGYLSGALKSTNIFVGSYVLQNKGDGAKFYPVEFDKSFTMPAGKCWLNDKVISASALRLDTDYVLDGVETIHNEAKDNGNVYNLDGTMATTMQPGRLYIKGGNTILKIR